MAQFPITDNRSIIDGLNYVLSGPGSLGQDFAGVSSYTSAYLTGNYRSPFSSTTAVPLYVAPINLSNAQQLDSRTIKYTFAVAQSTPPFQLGNGLTVKSVTPSTYNSSSLSAAGYSINQIGVVECTTTYVIVRTVDTITTTLGSYVSGGTVGYTSTDTNNNSTDLDVLVGVTSDQDSVFVSGQLDQIISYTTSTSQDLTVYVDINRYRAFSNNELVNPVLIYEFDETIVEKTYTTTGLTGTGTLPLIETIFANIIDQPGIGQYRYILEVYFETSGALLEVTQDELKLRSITAQVVKP
jgi:hypothetical protein